MPKKMNLKVVEIFRTLKKLHSSYSTELLKDRLKMLIYKERKV